MNPMSARAESPSYEEGEAESAVVLGLSVDEALSTTRAVRRRLDFDRSVPESVLRECIRLAVQAPTGSNMQKWRFVFVTERNKVEAIAEHYRRGFNAYRSSDVYPGRLFEGCLTPRAVQQARITASAEYLAANMHRSPVLLIPCIVDRSDGSGSSAKLVSQAGSVIPAAWSFMLAARERGLGTCWTTLHLSYEREVAEIVGIPYGEVRQVALIPVAYTKGTDFKPAVRENVDAVMIWNQWH